MNTLPKKWKVVIAIQLFVALVLLFAFSWSLIRVVAPNQSGFSVSGPEGISGKAGLSGEKGVQGPIGSSGKDSSVPGPVGATGPAGATGTTGVPGATGDQGPQGEMGQQGDPGTSGREVEFRHNDTKHQTEWRYVGDPSWQVLYRDCEVTSTCV